MVWMVWLEGASTSGLRRYLCDSAPGLSEFLPCRQVMRGATGMPVGTRAVRPRVVLVTCDMTTSKGRHCIAYAYAHLPIDVPASYPVRKR